MLKPISFVLLLTILTVSFRAQITVDGSDMPIVGHQYISESVIDLFIGVIMPIMAKKGKYTLIA